MSVITELFENYDHIPHEFRRQLLMMRELDDLCQKLCIERDALKKDILRKHSGELDDQQEIRIRRTYERIQQLYSRIEGISEEKLEIVQKLFQMKENFIRKLDQQIEKTEEDKYIQEKCKQDAAEEGTDQMSMGFPKQRPGNKKPGGRGIGGIGGGYMSGVGGGTKDHHSSISGHFGSRADSSFGRRGGGLASQDNNMMNAFDDLNITGTGRMGVGKKMKGGLNAADDGSDLFNMNGSGGKNLLGLDSSGPGAFALGQSQLGNQKRRDRTKDRIGKKSGNPFDSAGGSQFQMMGATMSNNSMIQGHGAGNKRGLPMTSVFDNYSQDEEMPLDVGQEDDQCFICQQKKIDDWIQCDTCTNWFHYSCVGVTAETVPEDRFDCPQCLGEANYADLK